MIKLKQVILRRSVFEAVSILELGHRRKRGETALNGVLEVVVDLAGVVADAHLTDAYQTLQLVLVEDVATVVVRHIASVVPRFPEQTGQQRTIVRRRNTAARQSSAKLQRNRRQAYR